jgi:hypothetical protein
VSNIRFLKRNEIDEHKWNEAINNSFNSLPYATSGYLDAIAENWGALVLNDFEAVMPLVWLRKLGIKCLYQPYYCQQLGVFSLQPLRAETHRNFLNAAISRFAYIHINLNPTAAVVVDDFSLVKKRNLMLVLNSEYPAVQKKYAENHRRNIAKANKAGLEFSEQTDLKSFQKFYLENINRVKENFKSKDEKTLKKLTRVLATNKVSRIFTAADETGALVAGILIVAHKNRLVAIINTSSPSGKKSGASHFLFDQIIKKYANSGLTLDFEGSSIATIARFYEGFGASEEVFYNLKISLIKSFRQRFS